MEKDLAETTKKVTDLLETGPRPLDRPLKRGCGDLVDVPRYRRGFVWSNSYPETISPAARSTETAEPLSSPPSHLLDDPNILCTMKALGGFIKVDTPFDVDRFDAILHDHPNRPFVESVVRGLREGFWPFEKGDWEGDDTDIFQNFAKDELDVSAIQAFHDKEVL